VADARSLKRLRDLRSGDRRLHTKWRQRHGRVDRALLALVTDESSYGLAVSETSST
jgi:hypothetical protein